MPATVAQTIIFSLTWRAADQQRMREYRRELRDIKSRVSERPYLFEQVTQVIDTKQNPQTIISQWQRRVPSGWLLVCSLGRKMQRLTLSRRTGTSWRKLAWRSSLLRKKERQLKEQHRPHQRTIQTRKIFIAGMHWEIFSCVHPRCNTAASGKLMNSTAAGEPRTSCGRIILHYIIVWVCQAISTEEKTIAIAK